MAKQVTAMIRLQVPGGQATPAPPVGPALGQHGVNIKQFVDQFNERTKDARGITVPVAITVFSDRTFIFEIKSPPAAVLLKQAAGIPLDGAADHGVSEALYLRDPDNNGVELYWDRPKEQWPFTADGKLAMFTRRLDLRSLLGELPKENPVELPTTKDL